MTGYYTYLISSLPMLQFGARPPFSFEKFIEKCQTLISDKDIELLKTALRPAGYFYDGVNLTLRKWQTFDTTLRNELAKIRASRKKIDPIKYQRGDGYPWPYFTHIAISAYKNPSPLEAQEMLDRERWNFLDELVVGHYFDIDFLIVYAYKLALLEKWEKIRVADKRNLIEETLQI